MDSSHPVDGSPSGSCFQSTCEVIPDIDISEERRTPPPPAPNPLDYLMEEADTGGDSSSNEDSSSSEVDWLTTQWPTRNRRGAKQYVQSKAARASAATSNGIFLPSTSRNNPPATASRRNYAKATAQRRRPGQASKVAGSKAKGFQAPISEHQDQKLLDRIKSLEMENAELRSRDPDATVEPPILEPTFTIIHSVDKRAYLEEPLWVQGDVGPELHRGRPLQDLNKYLDQHPEIFFVVYYNYDSRPPKDESKILSEDGTFKPAQPKSESLRLISDHLQSAVLTMLESIPEFQNVFPDFQADKEIEAPYLFAYYSLPLVNPDSSQLTENQAVSLSQLTHYIKNRYGSEYNEARKLAAYGMVTKRLLIYLIRPGDVLVSTQNPTHVCAYKAKTWARANFSSDKYVSDDDMPGKSVKDKDKKRKGASALPAKSSHSWMVETWSLRFDGDFKKVKRTTVIQMNVSGSDVVVDIDSLNHYPIQYANELVREVLKERGEIFWACRHMRLVSYKEDALNEMNTTSERYMIDTEYYKMLHPNSKLASDSKTGKTAFGPEEMASDDYPVGDVLYLFPSTLMGYQLRGRIWVELSVDRMSHVIWNKEAFQSLVIDEKSKELIQALLTNKIAADTTTDIIEGKGNGLTLLLHGGPGTGKTFTAEGVAELAEKPLLRINCGDVGTDPIHVEAYLATIFGQGHRWNCVILIDESDVFLEERRLTDLQRNALVSVFLRVIEYNVGILILTSNRVGTFDEAFKSRIQLALHYRNLTQPQRKKIWRNFLRRLERLDPKSVDHEDVIDHIDELGEANINGRQIRNVITTARQLAMWRKQKLNHEHLKHALDVSNEFEQYLKKLNDGFTDDQRQQEAGIR